MCYLFSPSPFFFFKVNEEQCVLGDFSYPVKQTNYLIFFIPGKNRNRCEKAGKYLFQLPYSTMNELKEQFPHFFFSKYFLGLGR